MTMLAVAIAVFSAKAQAMAPTIGYLPSPVIADDTPATGSRIFVYPDAMDLTTKASDPDGTVTPDQIIWSYTGPGGVQGRYLINGADALVTASDDPNAPGAKAISTTDIDPAKVDANPMTITLRDNTLSAIGSTPTAQTPGTPTIVANEVVTLFASDGSTYSMKSMMVYTEQDGMDRLSGGNIVMTPVSNEAPSGTEWTTGVIAGVNNPTFSTTGGGLCLGAPLTPDTYGLWVSPYGYTDLVQNAVYRFRLTMSAGSTLPAGTTPLWDFQVDNFTSDASVVQDKYGLDYLVLDNEGGANAPGASSTYDVWFTPAASMAADWNDSTNGEFTAAMDPRNDMRLTFRLLDTQVGANNADLDAGTLCLRNLEVTRIPMDQLPVESTVWSNTDLSAANSTVSTIFGATNTTINYSGGNLTVAPNTAGAGTAAWNAELIELVPGDDTSDVNTPSTLPDNWPVAWESGQLLRGTVSIQATSAAGETNPPDGIGLVFDTVTTEFTDNTWIGAGANTIGLPKLTPTNYVMYFYTQNQSATTIQNGKAMRLKAQILLTPNVNAGGSATNVNGVTINSMKVEKLALPVN
jgi:hypothetical protein